MKEESTAERRRGKLSETACGMVVVVVLLEDHVCMVFGNEERDASRVDVL